MPGARLTLDEREEIALGIASKRSFADIARQLGRPTSTVSREVDRNGGAGRYRATEAQRATDQRARRPKQRRLVADRRLAREVARRLKKRHSPEQIANRLRPEHPDEPHWSVSHETIYQSLCLQCRGGLRAELIDALRTGRARRRPKGPNPGRGERGRIKDMVLISERPAEVEDRAVPGHWEGDLMLGGAGRSQIATIVERTTRFTLLVRLPEDRKAVTVRDAVAAKIVHLPDDLRRSLTWDQGKETAAPSASPWPPTCRSTSATRTRRGSAAPTRTPTDCSASTCPAVATSARSPTASWTPSLPSSTNVLAKRSDG